jgi:hypothetical protein
LNVRGGDRRQVWIAVAVAAALALVALADTAPGRHFAARLARTHATRSELSSARLTRLLARSGELVVQPPSAAVLDRPVDPRDIEPDGKCRELELSGRQLPAAELPASTAAPSPWRDAGPPLLSLWLDPCRFARVHARPWQPGRDTEETGWVSFFENGKLEFAAPAAIRIHGGVSRRYPPYGYRLTFRSEHGSAGLPGRLVAPDLESPMPPLARFVVSELDDEDTDGSVWAFPGEVAYEIGRKLGAETPRTRPIWLSLNGAPATVYSISEHLDGEFLRRRHGHDNFELHRGKRHADDPRPESQASDRFWTGEMDWIAAAPAPFTRELAGARYDLEKLTTWLVTVLFNGTGDLYQEAMIRDRTGEVAAGRWSWIHWDHDMSFRTPPRNSRFGNKRDLLSYVLDKERALTSPQQALLHRLVEEDPEYRAEIVRRTTQALNHQLTPEYLESLVARYEQTARTLGITDLDWAAKLRDYFAWRPQAVRLQLQKMLGAGEPMAVELTAPAGTVKVDGFGIGASEGNGGSEARYAGIYPAGIVLEAEVVPSARARFLRWEIQTVHEIAEPSNSPTLRFTVWGPSKIVARFRD